MRPVLIDTNAYAAFKRGDTQMVEVMRHATEILVCTTVLGELLGGFVAGEREQKNRAELTQFLASPRVKAVPSTTATADFYALVYAALRRKGRPIPSNDMWIAASTLEYGAALLTFDGHFQAIDGLRVGRCLNDLLP